MHPVTVVVIQPVGDEELAQIARLDARLRVVDARGWFDEEIRQTWPQWTVDRYLAKRRGPARTREERVPMSRSIAASKCSRRTCVRISMGDRWPT